MSFIWVFVIGVSLMAGSLALVMGWDRRRARLLKEAGTALGLRAFEQGESLAVPSVELMRKRGRAIGAALEGMWKGEAVMVFDLSYPAGRNGQAARAALRSKWGTRIRRCPTISTAIPACSRVM